MSRTLRILAMTTLGHTLTLHLIYTRPKLLQTCFDLVVVQEHSRHVIQAHASDRGLFVTVSQRVQRMCRQGLRLSFYEGAIHLRMLLSCEDYWRGRKAAAQVVKGGFSQLQRVASEVQNVVHKLQTQNCDIQLTVYVILEFQQLQHLLGGDHTSSQLQGSAWKHLHTADLRG